MGTACTRAHACIHDASIAWKHAVCSCMLMCACNPCTVPTHAIVHISIWHTRVLLVRRNHVGLHACTCTQGMRPTPNCTGEEMAMHNLIQNAEETEEDAEETFPEDFAQMPACSRDSEWDLITEFCVQDDDGEPDHSFTISSLQLLVVPFKHNSTRMSNPCECTRILHWSGTVARQARCTDLSSHLVASMRPYLTAATHSTKPNSTMQVS